jgi:chaperonin GroEL
MVAGGGIALLRARANIKVKGDNPDQDAGIKIVLRAGEEPSVVVNKVLTGKGKYGFLVPSVAGLMLTTDCMIVEAPQDDKGQPGMGGMDM